MRYELAQTVGSTEPSHILSLLEEQLRKVAKKSVRNGSEITASGIEASFGSINRKSVVVFRIQSSPSRTLIVADVLYRPSLWFWVFEFVALWSVLGWIIPLVFYMSQRNTVKNAIIDVLRRVQTEAEFSGLERSVTVPISEQPIAPPLNYGDRTKLPDTEVKGSEARESFQLSNGPASEFGSSATKKANNHTWQFATVALGCTTLVFGMLCAYFLGSSRRDSTPATPSVSTPQIAAQPEVPAPSPIREIPSQVNPEITGVAQTETTSAASDQPETFDADINQMLESWSVAIRSNNASNIVVFYAPVGVHYFLQPSVDRAFILRDRQAELAKGIQILSFKLLDVRIIRDTDNSVSVSLIKAVQYSEPAETGIDTSGNATKNLLTRSMLKLDLVDGEWKIISERDFKS